MRSLLFVPGSSAKMMTEAADSGGDVVIYDLEDAVHPESKKAARPLVVEALAQQTEHARHDGFTAKAAIHPAQIGIINACFSPMRHWRRSRDCGLRGKQVGHHTTRRRDAGCPAPGRGQGE